MQTDLQFVFQKLSESAHNAILSEAENQSAALSAS